MSANLLPQKHFFDERYAQKKGQLHQYIQVSSSRIYTANFDPSTNEFVGLTDYILSEDATWSKATRSLEKLLPQPDFQQTKKTLLCIADNLYTLVPLSLFDEKEIETYFHFNHQIEANLSLYYTYTKIESLSAVIVYALPRSIHYLLKAKLPLFKSFHLALPLLEAVILQPKSKNNLFIHIQDKRFDIIHAPNHQLNYFNSFNYESAEDLIYFLLYAMEQLKIDQESVELIVLGEVEKKSTLFELLYKYIKNVKMSKRTKSVQFSSVLSEIPSQYYFSLFNQHLCE